MRFGQMCRYSYQKTSKGVLRRIEQCFNPRTRTWSSTGAPTQEKRTKNSPWEYA